MTELEYLNRHHEVTETYIGLARLRLQEGLPGEAGRLLDHCCQKLNELREERMGPELTAKAKAAGLIA
ncbi:hypothetical protein E6C67_08555 [Azospirillum sp. TSA2s]|uniref:hypothetical protein n=1 Tax=Azospirillum sp. TSA2s TaxID=709810 RepID=UPI0010AB36F5|nr:hypothetical protein [Azospirillum sp. TSA2s]QCG93989.1 hypothetical protein E6C67_08555 [Azospirillum sp. TSA2s]